MLKSELTNLLFTMTESEIKHKNHPELQRAFYKQFDTAKQGNQDVLVFKFLEQKKENDLPYSFNPNLAIVKHSRYSEIPTHIHDYIEMNYVYSGSCTAVVRDREIALKSGDVCIMDTNVPHTIKDAEEKDIVINFLMKKSYFTASTLSQLSSNSIISDFIREAMSQDREHNRFILFHCQESDKLAYLVENLLCEYYDPSFSAKDIIQAYMIIIFSELLRYYQTDHGTKSGQSKKTYILEILQHIEENHQTCTLESVAKRFAFHPNYLSRMIKNNTGKSFKQLLQEQKLNQASFLLVNTDKNLEEIMNEVGYHNHGFFNRIFQERFGHSPKEYRRVNQVDKE
ncbi:AraC family transcriptional regulator [Neobacillus dielmonensis]|uniref:AraC family transcriptional regulator n=1 Tax=Neobacillus dielmonensis TaxID=1347369 RepID=UPI0005AA3E29|nr:AraC family transcriptional regulator [Neobacillus dielmonensis]